MSLISFSKHIRFRIHRNILICISKDYITVAYAKNALLQQDKKLLQIIKNKPQQKKIYVPYMSNITHNSTKKKALMFFPCGK